MSWSDENTDMNGPVKLNKKDGKLGITPIIKEPYIAPTKVERVITVVTEEVPGTIGHIDKNIPAGKPILRAAYDVIRDEEKPGNFKRILKIITKK